MNKPYIILMILLVSIRPQLSADADADAGTEKAVFAAGCFWSIEYMFENLEGVVSAQSGYTGGVKDNPAYRDVSTGLTGHAEAVEVIYDPDRISYRELLKQFFNSHDTSQAGGTDNEYGSQYRSEIFYSRPEEKTSAREIILNLKKQGYIVNTRLTPAQVFWPAEEYHQDYYKKSGTEPYCEIFYGKNF